MHYYNDGADGFLWEPLYRKRSGLTPCEQEIVMHPALRRLQRIAHYGGSARILPMTHTRFTHTIGVFTLAVHFCPEDWLLRLAALLHDVGHLPFSHSAERGLGVDHHELTVRVLEESGLNAILRKHGFDPAAVLAVIEGRPPKVFLNKGAFYFSFQPLIDVNPIGIQEFDEHNVFFGRRDKSDMYTPAPTQ